MFLVLLVFMKLLMPSKYLSPYPCYRFIIFWHKIYLIKISLGQCLSGYIWASDSNNGYDINAEMEDRSDDENDGFYYYYSGIFHFLAMKIPFYFWLILIVAIIWYLIVLRVFCWSRQPTSPKPSQDQLATTFDWSTPSTSTIYYVWLLFHNDNYL